MENEYIVFKVDTPLGNSLAVQWLGFLTPLQGAWVLSLVKELRSWKPPSQKEKKIDIPQSTLN